MHVCAVYTSGTCWDVGDLKIARTHDRTEALYSKATHGSGCFYPGYNSSLHDSSNYETPVRCIHMEGLGSSPNSLKALPSQRRDDAIPATIVKSTSGRGGMQNLGDHACKSLVKR